MIELLALPQWKASPRSLDDWAAQLAGEGYPPTVVREPPDAAWLEIGPLRLRGYAMLEGGFVSAINFELSDPDPEPASRLVESAALALGWEVHPDEDGAEDDEDSD